ncbi:N-acetylmuramoyl-L-alanine amidase [Stenotrophomonas maltophilia]|uniref:N-acetylmuramoyl-L-alanine amidase n=1 Tax=Stenotrophomonas maltophilia TaxID=40324 RepID=UPI002B1DF022|nr:N-acetylmuramoyl-L-alanine amidase [Stenotrophomonas maltophilia]
MSHTPLLRSLAALCLIVTGQAIHLPAMAGQGGAQIDAARTDAELDTVLTRRAQEILDRSPRLEGQARHIRVRVGFELGAGILRIDFGPGFIPEHHGASFEDQHDAFRHELTLLAEQVLPVTKIVYLYEGRPRQDYFPEIREEDEAALRARSALPRRGHAFVSAAHGYYYHHGWRRWVLQRDEFHGVQEDFITPGYADELQLLLAQRSGAATTRPRSQLAEAVHPEALHPWWQMAARYAIRERFPENPRIWNSKGDRIYARRYYDDDINSRPLLANHVGSEVALHLHTNGVDDQRVTGARVVVQPGRPQDAELGRNILCYMKELIRSVDGYEEFQVTSEPFLEDKGENRLAEMPSAIVEMAFHTNPTDAAALLDPAFRTASMKGVEKGYRLFREGEGCVPLKVEPIQSIELSAGNSRRVDVVFEGHPRYPIDLVTTNVGCPPGWTCTDGKVHIAAPDEKPSQIIMKCENAGSAPLFWNTQVVDADGVKSPPVRHRVQCIRRPGGLSVAATALAGS